MIEISYKDIQFSKFSAIDSFGQVFYHEDQIYRLISKESTKECITMFDNGLISELTKKKYIPATKISETLRIKEIPDALILHHEKLIQTFIGEWSFSMIKSAALFVLELNSVLNDKGYELKDSHPFNILFKGTNPYWIDLGSIALRKGNGWIADREFFQSFYCTLKLWSDGEFYFINKALNDKWYPHQRFLPSLDIESSQLVRAFTQINFKSRIIFNTSKLSFKLCPYFKGGEKLVNLTNTILKSTSLMKGNLLRIETFSERPNVDKIAVEGLHKPQINSTWSNYHEHYYSEKVSERLLKIADYAISLNPSVVLDLAGNQGLMSELMANISNADIRFISTDYDENALDVGFNNISKHNKNINYVLINCILSGQRDNTVYSRLKADVVLALAVIHHLVLGQGYDINFILSEFYKFTDKYLIIEFMPLGLWSIENKEKPDVPDWYNLFWFRSALDKRFEILTEEQLEENRIMFIAVKK